MTIDPGSYQAAVNWYKQASNLERAGVKHRLFTCYPEIIDEKEAFVLAVKDERDQKPLP